MHTITLSYLITFQDKRFSFIFHDWNTQREKVNPFSKLNASPYYATPAYAYKHGAKPGNWVGAYLKITTDALAMMGTVNPDDCDYETVGQGIDAIVQQAGLSLDDFCVYRIDYAHNVVIEDEDQRDLLMMLYAKCTSHSNGQKNYAKLLADKETVTTSNRSYYKGKKKNVQIYDKTKERKNKKKPIQVHEENVLRLEVQVKWDEIKYQNREYGVPMDYAAWANPAMEAKYLTEPARIFFSGDFYSLKKVDGLLAKANVRADFAKNVHAFLVAVSRYGIDSAKTKYGRSANNYIRRLDDMGISPLTIPAKYGIDYLPNPFRSVLTGGAA